MTRAIISICVALVPILVWLAATFVDRNLAVALVAGAFLGIGCWTCPAWEYGDDPRRG